MNEKKVFLLENLPGGATSIKRARSTYGYQNR